VSTGQSWQVLPDLAARALGGSVVFANDEFFAERENLLRAGPAVFNPGEFGPKGKVYDGWETRRRREPGHDYAIVRLGAPGVIRGVVVDTAHFRGNFPPEASVEAAQLDRHPVPDLENAVWAPLVERSRLVGDSANAFDVTSARRWTHVRLSIYPDGGVARLRVHGEAVPDPVLLEALGTIDLAAAENGARVIDCSDRFYGQPDNLLAPGPARSMGEGWETARRRDDGNDFAVIRLAAAGNIRVAELDTSWFKGNAPGRAALTSVGDSASERLLQTPLLPDTRHRFVFDVALRGGPPEVEQVRLDIYPDGGMARLRLWGSPSDRGFEGLRKRWDETA
jgi:allantoicase